MTLIDPAFVEQTLTHEAPWCGSHGADGGYLGMGLVYYALVYATRAQTAVCLGSGGGFVPRLMRQAQRDLGLAGARTILVDGNRPEAGWGAPAWLPPGSFFRRTYPDVELLVQTTARAATEFFATQGLAIDYLHIDADHSFEGCLADFNDYRRFLRVGSVVTLHDTNFHGAGVRHVVEHLRARGDCEVVEFPEVGVGTAIVRITEPADVPRARPHEPAAGGSLRVERVADAPARAPAGRGWAYLESPSFSVRSMIAASFMRGCDTVIELGAGRRSIEHFLGGTHRSVIVIDPLLHDRSTCELNGAPCAVEHVRARFQDLRWHLGADASFGLVMLGMELQNMAEADFTMLFRLVDAARATVIEFPTSWWVSQEQFQRLQHETRTREVFFARIDLSGNDFGDLSNSWPPRCDREIHVLQPA